MSRYFAKFKAGPLQRWGAYWKQLRKDYSEVVSDTIQEAKDRPLKASVAMFGCGAALVAWNTAPDLRTFSDQLTEADARLRLLPAPLRCPAADQHVCQLRRLQADRLLQAQNLGPISLLWRLPYPEGTGLAAAQCVHVLPPYATAGERVLDVGAFGVWWTLRRRMNDFDVNDVLLQEEILRERNGTGLLRAVAMPNEVS